MTAFNVASRASMVAGQPEDISPILANFDALATILNGNLDNANLSAAAAIAQSKVAFTGYSGYGVVFTSSGGGAPAIGNATVIARYAQVGKIVHCLGRVIFGGTTNLGNGALLINLPVTAAVTNISNIGHVYGTHVATNLYAQFTASLVTGTTFNLIGAAAFNGASAAVSGSASFPWAWVAPDELNWNLLYEAV